MKKRIFIVLVFWSASVTMTTIHAQEYVMSEEATQTDIEEVNDIIALIDEGNHKEALTAIEAAIKLFKYEENYLGLSYTEYYKGKCLIHTYDVSAAIEAYKRSISLGRKHNIPLVKAMGFNALQVIYDFQGNYEAVKAMADSILSIKDVPLDVVGDAYEGLGTYFDNNSQPDSSFKYRLFAYQLDTTLQDSTSWATTALAMGRTYSKRGKLDSALHFFIEGAEIASSIKRSHNLSHTYLSISLIFTEMENLFKAREYANLALGMADPEKTKSTYNAVIAHLGYLDEIEGYFESAIRHYTNARLHYDSINSLQSLITCNIGLANCYLETGRFEKAKNLMDVTRSKIDSSSFPPSALRLFLIEAKIALKEMNPAEAKVHLVKAEKMETSSPSLINKKSIEGLYALVYEQLNDYQKANKKLKTYHKYRDSLANQNQAFIIHDLESKYKKRLQEQEISNLTTEKKILDTQVARKNRIIQMGIIFLIITVILIGIILTMLRNIRSKNALISQSLKEKETLLKEIHHRVKNNLQIISSLLSLQTRNVKDEAALNALQESQTRVRSMALIHQNLYQHDNMVQVNVKEYITNLSDELLRSYKSKSQKINLNLDISSIQMDLDEVIPLGLVINELITNAIKYAFPKEKDGTINIFLRPSEKHIIFSISDDGIGLPNDFDINKTKSLGFRLVRSFCNKMEADYTIQNDNGLKVELKIPVHPSQIVRHD